MLCLAMRIWPLMDGVPAGLRSRTKLSTLNPVSGHTHKYKEGFIMSLPFQGPALALSSDGLASVASNLGVHAPEIWAVLAVETKGCGYLPDRRPQILY